MESNVQVSRSKIVLMWGGIMGAALYGLSFVLRVSGLETVPALSFILNTIVFGACMSMAVKQWRDKGLGGYISYGHAFSTGLLTGLFATLITVVFTGIALSITAEEFQKEMDDRKLEQIAIMEDQGASDDQIEMTEKIFDWFNNPQVILTFILVLFAIGSAIMALIVAAIFKKDNPNEFGLQ